MTAQLPKSEMQPSGGKHVLLRAVELILANAIADYAS